MMLRPSPLEFSLSQVKQALDGLGLRAHRRAIRELIEKLDIDGDGEVDMVEFMQGVPDEMKQLIEDKIPIMPLEAIRAAICKDVDARPTMEEVLAQRPNPIATATPPLHLHFTSTASSTSPGAEIAAGRRPDRALRA